MEELQKGKIRDEWEQFVVSANDLAHTLTELDIELTKGRASLAKKKLLELKRNIKEFDYKLDEFRKQNNIY